MQQSNLPSSVRDRIPEYVIDSYPIFVDFIQTYYRYAYQRDAGVGSIQYRALDADIDTTLDAYIDEFYNTYGAQLPKEIAADKRNFVKLLNSIYNAKGTEDALKLLFQGVFGERITVSYPGENVLRASDGKWVQERFFTAIPLYGDLPAELPFNVEFTNAAGSFSVLVTHVDYGDPSSVRVFFDARTPVYAAVDQQFTVYSPDGDTIWAGKLIDTPGYLDIITPGEAWQVGQVVIIPGAISNTVARVTRVSSTGGIENIEILEHGLGHDAFQTIQTSPYPNRPPASEVQVESVLTQFDPPVFHHTVTINDYTDGFSETIGGLSDSVTNGNTYFLENYVQVSYSGTVVIGLNTFTGTVVNSQQDTGLTYQEWLNSRATLQYVPQPIVKSRGYYANFDGHISNQEIRLQDNYFYQAFSYLIETTKNITEYKNVLQSLHPAGTKMFADLMKQTSLAFTITSSRTFSLDTLYLLDYIGVQDTMFAKAVSKKLEDIQYITDSVALSLNKPLTDSVSALSDDIGVMTPVSYSDITYFEERYTIIDFEVSIG